MGIVEDYFKLANDICTEEEMLFGFELRNKCLILSFSYLMLNYAMLVWSWFWGWRVFVGVYVCLTLSLIFFLRYFQISYSGLLQNKVTNAIWLLSSLANPDLITPSWFRSRFCEPWNSWFAIYFWYVFQDWHGLVW